MMNRRDLIQGAAGFGALALGGARAFADDALVARPGVVAPRAKRVIFLFMQGGPSHVDTFDYKPELQARDGQSIDFTGVRFGTFGKQSQRRLLKPLWDFRQYGESGQWVSELFPHQARIVDRLCFLHGMHTEGVAHGPSTLFMHTGATNLVRPSLGSWISYGIGTENQDMPAFVTLLPSATKGGPRNYASAFLPVVHQGTPIGAAGQPARDARVRHLQGADREQIELQRALARLQRAEHGADDRLDAELSAFDLADRMQRFAPGVLDLSDESAATLAHYGVDEKPTDDFARQCIMARRLCEAGVRFVQVNYADESANPRWDQHSNMPAHAKHARATDKPVAALVEDLEARGLLEDTLVWWGGEFGRTPFAQGKDGRDHNPRGFTIWLAGAGVKAGHAHGATDEIGHEAVEGKVHMRDLHATILHMLGLDHERLTYRWSGRDFRLTDVEGHVVHEIFA